jgi:hypothetical protein
MVQVPEVGNNSTEETEPLGEEYEVVPSEFRFHDGSGLGSDPTCPDKEDQDNIQALGQAVQNGLASSADADRIYRGRTV